MMPTPPRSRPDRLPHVAGVLLLFTAVAVLSAHPYSVRPHEVLPDNTDAVISSWTLSWVAHQLPRDPWHVFQANDFHPDRAPLAYAEPLLVPGLLAVPFRAATGNDVFTYNAVFVVTLVLSALFACLLARELPPAGPRRSWPASSSRSPPPTTTPRDGSRSSPPSGRRWCSCSSCGRCAAAACATASCSASRWPCRACPRCTSSSSWRPFWLLRPRVPPGAAPAAPRARSLGSAGGRGRHRGGAGAAGQPRPATPSQPDRGGARATTRRRMVGLRARAARQLDLRRHLRASGRSLRCALLPRSGARAPGGGGMPVAAAAGQECR